MDRSGIGRRRFGGFEIWLAGLFIAFPAISLILLGQLRLFISFVLFSILILIWTYSRPIGLKSTFIFLLTLGDIRRIADMVTGASSGSDPILLVGPIVTVYIAVPLFFGLKLSDRISKAVLALMAIMVLEIFNPRQGPLAVGLGGALFYIIPFLWFWIGRHYATEKTMFTLLYGVLIPVAVAAAILGIAQTYIGFLPWEDVWVKSMGSMFLLSTGHYRSFGFSTVTIEYTNVLLIGATCMTAAFLNGKRAYVILIAILIPAIVLSSSRGLVIKFIMTVALLWSILGKSSKSWIPRLVFSLTVGLTLLVYSATRVATPDDAPVTENTTTAQSATAHLTGGLAHPLDEKHSTAGIHTQIIGEALLRGFTYPIGYGLGSVTLAASKFSGDETAMLSSEFDLSDAFTSMGLVGGLLYLYIVVSATWEAVRYVRTGPRSLSLPILGVLFALSGGWTGLGQYPIGPLALFFVGFLVRNQTLAASKPTAAKAKQPVGANSPVALTASTSIR